MKEPIITLDNEMHDRHELTQKAIQDSFYYGYLAKACLSSSAISQLLKSPLKALAPLNILAIYVTFEVFQLLKSPLKA